MKSVYIINQLAKEKLNDVKVVLISANKKQYYSGEYGCIYYREKFSRSKQYYHQLMDYIQEKGYTVIVMV